MPVVPARGRLRQEDCKFEASLRLHKKQNLSTPSKNSIVTVEKNDCGSSID
jgi:hypothetical protein